MDRDQEMEEYLNSYPAALIQHAHAEAISEGLLISIDSILLRSLLFARILAIKNQFRESILNLSTILLY